MEDIPYIAFFVVFTFAKTFNTLMSRVSGFQLWSDTQGSEVTITVNYQVRDGESCIKCNVYDILSRLASRRVLSANTEAIKSSALLTIPVAALLCHAPPLAIQRQSFC